MASHQQIGVGIIGYEVGRSWGANAHVPALRALPEYRVAAVATTRAESALAAGADIGLPADRAFASAAELVACADVDVVAVTVKVPFHLELVRMAIAAGKHVYCEWPLGNGLAEAEEMAELVAASNVRAVVGLQARCAPAVDYVRSLVADGDIGEILSSTMLGSGMQWGNSVDLPNSYILDQQNGASLLTIPFGHTVDAMCYCLGEFTSLSATTAIRIPQVRRIEDGAILAKSVPDQIALTGVLEGGAVASVHYRGGVSRGTNFVWEINGAKGDLRIEAAGGHAQMFELSVSGGFGKARTVEPLAIPDKHRWVPAGIGGLAVNVAQVYRRFSQDLRSGGSSVAGFKEAQVRHRMIAAIEQSALSGERVSL